MSSEHDKRYKKLFSNTKILRELLETFVKEEFVNRLDFSTLTALNKSFVTSKYKTKECDLIFIAFQSEGETMQAYICTYCLNFNLR